MTPPEGGRNHLSLPIHQVYQKRPRPLAIVASTPLLYLADEVDEELEDVHDDVPETWKVYTTTGPETCSV